MATYWTPEKIENYKQASEYSSFHRKLSVLAEPFLDESWTLADIGCGLGLIENWLAPMVSSIDAIDVDEAAINDLKARLDDVFLTSKAVAEKVAPIVASIDDLAGDSWDVITLSFFGLDEEVLGKVLPLAKKRALIFMHGRADADGPLAAEDDGSKFTATHMEDYLKENNYLYKKTVMEMQFGQPFKSIEDIHTFLSAYGIEGDDRRATDAEERIIKTNRFDYPYYLPKSISVALFIISTGKGER